MAIVARVALTDVYDNPNALAEACTRYRETTATPETCVLFVEFDPQTCFYNIEDVSDRRTGY